MQSGRLYLEFCGEDWSLDPGDQLTFGRSGDLVIDDNPYLHRTVGRFVWRQPLWWLENQGRSIVVTVRQSGGPSAASVGPGSSLALVHGEFTCSFSAGPTRYELSGALGQHEWETDLLGPDGVGGTRTLDWARVDLNAEQRQLLVALCEERLLRPSEHDLPLPGNRQLAARLGWRLTKFNRKLDHLCEKLQRAGVTDVHGGLGASAVDRRRRLVDHAVSSGMVTAADLHLLGEPGRVA
jgi:hypothetical protein